MATRSSKTDLSQSYEYEVTSDGTSEGVNKIVRELYPDNYVIQGSQDRWRQKIRKGENATTYSEGTLWEYWTQPADFRHWIQHRSYTPPVGSRKVRIQGTLMFLGIPNFGDGLVSTSAQNQALSRYYSNVSEVSTAFKGMVFTGELKESLMMILSPAKSLRRGVEGYLANLRRLKKRKVSKRQLAKLVSEAWLEAQFGWLPLISDIDNAIEAWHKSKYTKPIFQMVSGIGHESNTIDTPLTNDLDMGAGYRFSYGVSIQNEVTVKFRGITDSVGSGIGDAHHYGWKPSEFVPTLWELIPFSFLVDYFTNIGDLVSSWSYRQIGTRWTSRSVFWADSACTINPNFRFTLTDPPYANGIDSAVPGFSLIRRSKHVRTPSVTPDLPSFEVQAPGCGTKWVNIAALATSLALTRKALYKRS